MSFLLFLRGLVGVLIVFAVVTYVMTQSVWTTLVQTVICAILLQIGYFAAVLFLVWRSGAGDKRASSGDAAPAPVADDKAPRKVGRLPDLPHSGHP